MSTALRNHNYLQMIQRTYITVTSIFFFFCLLLENTFHDGNFLNTHLLNPLEVHNVVNCGE